MTHYEILTSFTFLFFLSTCDDPQEDLELGPDEFLLELESKTSDYVWFGNSEALLDRSSESGHPETQLRTRYNSKAAEKLNSEGRVIEGTVFEDGSLIVKELVSNGSLNTLAIMYKDANNEFADANGWLWGYFDGQNKVRQSAVNKGVGCRGCHLQSGHIDLTLMNKAFNP